MKNASASLRISLILVLLAVPVAKAQYALEPTFGGQLFNLPVEVTHAGDGSGRMFVTEKWHGVKVVTPGNTATTFLDLYGTASGIGELGVVGLAFAPDFAVSGLFYVFYNTPSPYRSIIARYEVDPVNPDTALASSETIIIDQPLNVPFHNGGKLAFGRDRMLYISMGDDSDIASAQDLTSLKGSILRIDVSSLPYTIPPDNPFAGNAMGYSEEIYAYGFRNPFRFSFDRVDGTIWCGDVGESAWEEVDIILPGANYGWPLLEGNTCFSPPSCDTAGVDLEAPVYVYPHPGGGNAAIIGGHVYRGALLPELYGKYIFADYTSGEVWSLEYDGVNATVVLLIDGPQSVQGIGVDVAGELYFTYNNGVIRKLVSTVTNVAPSRGLSGAINAYPNPFNPTTTISLDTPSDGTVRLTIHDARGRYVRTLMDDYRAAGRYTVQWDGRSASGGVAASGVYFCRLAVDGHTVATRRLVLLK